MKHTGSNWGFTKRNQGDYIIMSPPQIGIHVALVHNTANSPEEIKANAKLIAAAPELLEVLIEMTDYLQGMDSNKNVIIRIPLSLSKKVGNVIKKATT